MIFIDEKSSKASFYFALEEFIMCQLRPTEPVLMIWKTNDTVMIGANQIVSLEVNLDYAEQNNIAITRRASGGGAIFTDEGTLLYTIIIPFKEETDPKDIVEKFLAKPVISALSKIGIEAVLEGRNDILISGKKFSGIAQHIRKDYLCSHGSLLFNANLNKLENVLDVDREKMVSKGICSVASRVTNIITNADGKEKELDIYSFKKILIDSFSEYERLHRYSLSFDELQEVDKIVKTKYENDEWTHARATSYSFSKAQRFEAGKVEVFLNIDNDVITQIKITGDFLSLKPISELEDILKGVIYSKNAISKKLESVNLNNYLGQVKAEELVAMML